MNSVSKKTVALTLSLLLVAACSESERAQTADAEQSEQLNEQPATTTEQSADSDELSDDLSQVDDHESSADDDLQLSIEESMLRSMQAISNKQLEGSEQDSVEELESLSESDRQALQSLATKMTMDAAQSKAEKQAKQISEALLPE